MFGRSPSHECVMGSEFSTLKYTGLSQAGDNQKNQYPDEDGHADRKAFEQLFQAHQPDKPSVFMSMPPVDIMPLRLH